MCHSQNDSPVSNSNVMSVVSFCPKELSVTVDLTAFKRKVCLKLVTFLSANPYSPSSDVITEIGQDNITQVCTGANRLLYNDGFMVGCARPPVPFQDKLVQEERQTLWSLYRLPDEALITGNK